ncbi:hypothetical protein FRB90_008749 [Tulasnella sp. 427]|nr:hypothetical protein FRB90_008749 [Tulasnella sp. 427]
MSEDLSSTSGQGTASQPPIRKLRLKILSAPAAEPSLSFDQEWQEIDGDPFAGEDDPYPASTDPPQPSDPKDNIIFPQFAPLNSEDNSSDLPEISEVLARPTAPKRTTRKRTDSAPAPPPAKRSKNAQGPPQPRQTLAKARTKGPKPSRQVTAKAQSKALVHNSSPRKSQASKATSVKQSATEASVQSAKNTPLNPHKKPAAKDGAQGAPTRKGKKRAISISTSSSDSGSGSPETRTPLIIGIDIEVAEELATRQRKGKETQRISKFDAFEVESLVAWPTVLDRIAAKLRTTVGCLRLDTFTWRPSQPKNAEARSLNSDEAWKICVKRLELKPKSAFIVIRMAPPNPPPKQLSWAQNAGPSTSSTAATSLLSESTASLPVTGEAGNELPQSLGATDALLTPIVQKLQQMYPKDACRDHPSHHCFLHAPTSRHYAVEGLAAKAWASQIHFQSTDYYRLPNSVHFHPSKALPLAAPPSARPESTPAESQVIPQLPTVSPANLFYPATPTAPLGHIPFMTPFTAFNPFNIYGFPPQTPLLPHLNPSVSTAIHPSASTSVYQSPPAHRAPDGPLSSPPKGMTLRDWCTIFKLDDTQYGGLVKLGFKISMQLDGVAETDWREAGFTLLGWKQTVSAAAAYRADRARTKTTN